MNIIALIITGTRACQSRVDACYDLLLIRFRRKLDDVDTIYVIINMLSCWDSIGMDCVVISIKAVLWPSWYKCRCHSREANKIRLREQPKACLIIFLAGN